MSPVGRPEVRSAGDNAVLLDCADLEEALRVFAILTAAREAGQIDVEELIPAAQTVLVRGGDARDRPRFAVRFSELYASSDSATATETATSQVEIPVIYDGGDLAEVAELTGLDVEEVIARHTAATYTVAFTGFAPGFAYLSGGDPRLLVPRRATPRPRIQAGSVGLAGPFSGVYPRESPGGWQLIGHTEVPMWDLDREPPALLTPGARVRFVRQRESSAVSAPAGVVDGGNHPGGTTALTVVDPGLQTLVQDEGRPGLASMGVSSAGVADRGALRRANRLVGNPRGAAVLELGHGGFCADAQAVAVLALSGAPRPGRITGPLGTRAVPGDRAFRIDPGERLELDEPERGLRSVLALRGGVVATPVLGSSSRDTLAGLGPRPLRAGDSVRVGPAPRSVVEPPEPASELLPVAGEETVLRVIPGPRDDWFGAAGVAQLCAQPWQVTPRSDRVGVRLAGAALTRAAGFSSSELPSEGLVEGSIQVPADGQPVLFLADRPLTGGYPVIGVIRTRDLDRAAQLPPGALVRFEPDQPELARPITDPPAADAAAPCEVKDGPR